MKPLPTSIDLQLRTLELTREREHLSSLLDRNMDRASWPLTRNLRADLLRDIAHINRVLNGLAAQERSAA